MEIGLERFVLAAAAVLDIDPEQLVPAIKVSLAESALAAPFASFGGHDFYPDPITRAAVLASRIMRNHPLPDGNKRVALVLMDIYLQGQGFEFGADPDKVDEVFRAVAARSLAEDDFADWLREHVARPPL
jgi:death-on-curing protein